MLHIPLLRATGGLHRSLDAAPLRSYRGQVLAQVSQAPPLLARLTCEALRAAPPVTGYAALWSTIRRAADLLEHAELGGLGPEEYCRTVTGATGTPIRWVRAGLRELAAGLRRIDDAVRYQTPHGQVAPLAHHRVWLPDGRMYAWIPAGRLLGVVCPASDPAVHLTWVLALALGWSVVVRPGADDPLTPLRLALALLGAGLPPGRLAVLPGSHDLVPLLVEACDRTIVYGGQAMQDRWGRDNRVLFHGPGRSRVFVDAPPDPPPGALLDFLVDCAVFDGGRRCTCASAVVVRGQAASLTGALAARLADLAVLDPLDEGARVPAWKDPAAARAAAEVAGTRLLERDGAVFVAPAAVEVPDAADPRFALELPCPYLTVLRLPEGARPLRALQGALSLTLLTRDHGLAEACVRTPSIGQVFLGAIPTYAGEPGAPLHGRLSEFLFTTRGCGEGPPLWS